MPGVLGGGEVTTSKRPSMRAAINAMCRQCIYDPKGSGTWRQQVEACTSPNCPLYPLRPVSKPLLNPETMFSGRMNQADSAR